MGALGRDLPDTEEQLFELNHLPLLNTQIVENMFHEQWAANFSKMIPIFLDTLPKEKALIESAHIAHDWQKIDFLAHKMKGGCVYMGAQKLAIACQYLERYIKAGHTKQLEKLYEQMMNTINETFPAASEWLKTH